jgi:hypothetical protein
VVARRERAVARLSRKMALEEQEEEQGGEQEERQKEEQEERSEEVNHNWFILCSTAYYVMRFSDVTDYSYFTGKSFFKIVALSSLGLFGLVGEAKIKL